MKVQFTREFLGYHNPIMKIMDSERKLKQRNSHVVGLDQYTSDVIDRIVSELLNWFNASECTTLRVLGILTGKGDSISWHSHDEEYTILYYMQGKSPLHYENGDVIIRPGTIIHLDPGEKHSVKTEEIDRYAIGILYQ